MNYSTAIFLVNDAVRCVEVSYDQVEDRTGKRVPTNLVSFKTLDADLAKDDLVIIPTDTRYGFTVGKVTRVDLDVDFDSPQQMRWVVGKVDTDFIEDVTKQEEKAMAAIRHAEVKTKKQELAEKLHRHNPDLAGLSLFHQTDPAPKDSFDPEPPKRGGAQS